MKGHGALAMSVSSSGEMFYVAYVYVNGIWEWGALTPNIPRTPNPKISDPNAFNEADACRSSHSMYAAPRLSGFRTQKAPKSRPRTSRSAQATAKLASASGEVVPAVQ